MSERCKSSRAYYNQAWLRALHSVLKSLSIRENSAQPLQEYIHSQSVCISEYACVMMRGEYVSTYTDFLKSFSLGGVIDHLSRQEMDRKRGRYKERENSVVYEQGSKSKLRDALLGL